MFRELSDRRSRTTGGRSNTSSVNGVGHYQLKNLFLTLQLNSKLLVRKFLKSNMSVHIHSSSFN